MPGGGVRQIEVVEGPLAGIYEVDESELQSTIAELESQDVKFRTVGAPDAGAPAVDAPAGPVSEEADAAVDRFLGGDQAEGQTPENNRFLAGEAKDQAPPAPVDIDEPVSRGQAKKLGALDAMSRGLADEAGGFGAGLAEMLGQIGMGPEPYPRAAGRGIGAPLRDEPSSEEPFPLSAMTGLLGPLAPAAALPAAVVDAYREVEQAAPGAVKAGQSELRREMGEAREEFEQEPWYSDPFIQGQVMGGLATSPPVMPSAPSQATGLGGLAARAVQSTVHNLPATVSESAVYGAGSAEGGERLEGAAGGALSGVAAQAVLGPAGELLMAPARAVGRHLRNRMSDLRSGPGRSYALFETGMGEPAFLSRTGEDLRGNLRPGRQIEQVFEQAQREAGEAAPDEVFSRRIERSLVEAYEGYRRRATKLIADVKNSYFTTPEARRKVPTDRFVDDLMDEMSAFGFVDRSRFDKVLGEFIDPVTKAPRKIDARSIDAARKVLRDMASPDADYEQGVKEVAGRLYAKLNGFVQDEVPGLHRINKELAAPLLGEKERLLESAGFPGRTKGLEPEPLSDARKQARKLAARYPYDPNERESIQTVLGERVPGDDPGGFSRRASELARELHGEFSRARLGSQDTAPGGPRAMRAAEAEAGPDVEEVLQRHPELLRDLRVMRALSEYMELQGQPAGVRALGNPTGIATYADVSKLSQRIARAVAGLTTSRPGGVGDMAAEAAAKTDLATDEDVSFLDRLLEWSAAGDRQLPELLIGPMMAR